MEKIHRLPDVGHHQSKALTLHYNIYDENGRLVQALSLLHLIGKINELTDTVNALADEHNWIYDA